VTRAKDSVIVNGMRRPKLVRVHWNSLTGQSRALPIKKCRVTPGPGLRDDRRRG
jgi:hypothetical protein